MHRGGKRKEVIGCRSEGGIGRRGKRRGRRRKRRGRKKRGLRRRRGGGNNQ